MKVYLAGPMRNYAQFNFPAFHEGAAHLRSLGYEVFSPAERDAQVGFDPTEMDGDENLADLGFDLREALAADTAYISQHADAIALLPGWESSAGVRAEKALGEALGLLIAPIEDFYSGGVMVTAGDGPRVVRHEGEGGEVYLPFNVPMRGWPTGEVRVTSATGGQKGTKPERFDLIPAGPLRKLAHLYGNGAAKYEARNWERGYDWSLSFAAAMRHLWLFWGGEDIDAEMGLPHLTCAAFHLFALTEFLDTHPEFDNRPRAA